MQRVNLDAAPPAVREFVSALPVEPDGVELEIDGQVVCKVIGRNQLSEQERDAIMAEGLKLIRQSQRRNEGVRARVIASEIGAAIDDVRRQQ